MTAAYRALADELIDAIRSGAYRPGEKLPTIRALSEERGEGFTIVQDAYRVLVDEGWVTSGRRTGTYVVDDLPAPGAARPTHEERIAALEAWRAEVEARQSPEQ